MQDGSAQRPAVPAQVLDAPPAGAPGPSPGDWRVAALALTGAPGEHGWVALRVEPFEVLKLAEDRETAEVLAAMRAKQDRAKAFPWVEHDGWSEIPCS